MRKEQRVHCTGFLCLYLFGLVLVLTDRKWTGELRLNVLGNVRPKGNWASKCSASFLSVIVAYKYTSIMMGRK